MGKCSTFFTLNQMSPLQKIARDPAFWTLILLNVFFIYEYKDDPKQYTSIIWLYWCQSVLIGVFNFLDMLTLKNADVSNMNINGKPATVRQAKGCLPFFFLFHYGIFHLVYFVFLLVDFKLSDTNFTYMKLALGGILLQQAIHFIQNKTIYSNDPRNIGTLFFTPYLRIVPMHLTILLPKFLGWTPALTFLILKTLLDVTGHLVTTRYYWSKEERKPEERYV